MNWTRIAYNSDVGVAIPSFADVTPWRTPGGQVPEYPRASNDPGVPPAFGGATAPQTQRNGYPAAGRSSEPSLDALRAELRALVVEELAQLMKR
jgi:hypothetical protein